MSREAKRTISRRTMLQAAGGAGALAMTPATMRQGARARQNATPVAGGTFTYGNPKPSFNVISPLNTVGTGQNVLIEAMFLRLIYGREWGPGVNPQPEGPLELAVAETINVVEADRVWEFKLRENVLWHDGPPVTADDVIFGIWLSLNKNAKTFNETPVVGILGGDELKANGAEVGDIVVRGATKLDEYAVRIELEKPIPNYWVNWSVGYWPCPMHIFGETNFDELFDEPYATMPVGNGPFKALNYVDEQYMEFAPNEDFYAGAPLLEKFIVRFGDADTLTAALEAQEIDGMNVTPGPVYDRLTLSGFVGNPVPRDHPDGVVVNVERFPEHAAALNKATSTRSTRKRSTSSSTAAPCDPRTICSSTSLGSRLRQKDSRPTATTLTPHRQSWKSRAGTATPSSNGCSPLLRCRGRMPWPDFWPPSG